MVSDIDGVDNSDSVTVGKSVGAMAVICSGAGKFTSGSVGISHWGMLMGDGLGLLLKSGVGNDTSGNDNAGHDTPGSGVGIGTGLVA